MEANSPLKPKHLHRNVSITKLLVFSSPAPLSLPCLRKQQLILGVSCLGQNPCHPLPFSFSCPHPSASPNHLLPLKTSRMHPDSVWLCGLAILPRGKRPLAGFPGRAHAWVVSQVPRKGAWDRQPMVFLSLSPLLPLL